MGYWNLAIAVLCAFAAAINFKGTFIDAANVAFAVANFGLFLRA